MRHAAEATNVRPHFFWRRTAQKPECRWREKIEELKTAEDEPQHPAEKNDTTVGALIDMQCGVAGRNGHEPPSKKATRAPNKATTAKAKATPTAARAKNGRSKRRDDATPLNEATYVRLHAKTFGVMQMMPKL